MILDEETYLEHFGVKGMKWGVRHDGPPGVSNSTNRQAKKDAQEFARAKMFYGEGAGTRRKLIKAKVEDRAKHDPAYKKAFDHHLANQSMSDHSQKAVGERKRKDFKKRNKQRAGFLARNFTGQMGNQAAFTAIALGGVTFLASPKGQQMARNGVTKVKNSANARRGRKMVQDFLKAHG